MLSQWNRLIILFASFHGRLRSVIAENNESISEKLRNGIHKAPEIVLPFRNDILGFEDLVSLNNQENFIIKMISLNNMLGTSCIIDFAISEIKKNIPISLTEELEIQQYIQDYLIKKNELLRMYTNIY